MMISSVAAFVGCGGEEGKVTVPPGMEKYTFAAACTDLTDLEGTGWSGGNSGIATIGQDIDGVRESISGYYVGYLYSNGATITFEINSDKAVSDATITLSITGEGTNELTLTSESYTVSVNDTVLDYNDITLYDLDAAITSQNKFVQYELATNVALKEGKNIITLTTSNDDSMGGTTEATAPLVDCIQITTSAVLSWNPVETNLDQFA